MAMISLILVDDEEDLLEVARHFLERSGDIRVETATSASRALEMHRNRPGDAIVSDFQMPGMDGIEFLKKLRGEGDTTPFIILTGKGREQVAIEALNLGADFYLQKGGDPRALFTELENMVRKSVKNHHADRVFLESEQRYRAVVEDQTELISRFFPDGTHVFANDAYCRYFGKDRGEIVGTRFTPEMPRDDRDLVRTHLASLTREEPVGTIEHRVLMPGGEIRWQQWTNRAIFNKEGEIIEYQSVGRDITDRKKAEEQLRISESLYRTIFETAGAALAILDEEGIVLMANSEIEPLLGFRPEELEGKIPWSSFVPPDELPRFTEYWRLLHEDPSRASQHYEARLVDRWGKPRHGIVSVKLIPHTPNCVISITDITGLRKADEKLRLSETLYRTIFTTTGTATVILDGNGTIILANREVESLLGFPPGELEGRAHWSSFASPDELPRLAEQWRLLHEDPAASAQHYAAKIVDRWGNIKHGSVSIALIPGSRNSVASIMDTTEHRKAEEELRESRERYRLLAETSPDMIYLIDPEGVVQYANSTAARRLRGGLTDIIGKHLGDLFPPQVARSHLDGIRHVVRTRQGLSREVMDEFQGGPCWIDVRLSPVFDEQGRVTGILGLSRDITERKHTEEALRESEEKYRTLVERAADGIVVIQDHSIVFCNTRAAEMWGGVPAELVGRQFMDFVDRGEVPRILEIYRKELSENAAPQVYDITLRRKDGNRFHAGIHAGTIPYRGRPAALVFLRDITERKRSEDALLTAHKKLNLLSSITRHDIRNQLMVILGYTEILRQEARDTPAARIIASVEDAARTIQHHIEFTKEYQEIGINAPAWQDLREVILRAGARFNPGKVRIAVDLDRIDLYADPLLERVFYNLIDNALKHGGTLTAIRFSTEESAQGLTIGCEDDGQGIPAEDKERIFSPGFGGTSGYGLFLVREILDITGIAIHERGIPGKGAGFKISVPPGAYRVRR